MRIFVLMNKSNAEALPKAGKGWMMENSFYSRHTLTDDEYGVFLFIKNFLFLFYIKPFKLFKPLKPFKPLKHSFASELKSLRFVEKKLVS